MELTRGKILTEAQEIINADRQDDYGPPEKSFETIAAFWSVYLKKKITAADVAFCMVLLKLAREMHQHKHDSLLDMAGYIGLACDLQEREITDGNENSRSDK